MANQEEEMNGQHNAEEKKIKKPRKMGVNKTGELSAWWVKFFERLRGFDALEVSKWADQEILGYLCSKYEKLYGHSFSFSLKGSPSRCDEMFAIKKIKIVLNNDNPKFIKDYIDWVFEKKLEGKQIRIVSMKYFMTPGLCNEFKHHHIRKNKISRATQLPDDIAKALAEENHSEIVTYGDLAFIKMAVESSPDADEMKEYKDLLNLVERHCLDLKILNTLDE